MPTSQRLVSARARLRAASTANADLVQAAADALFRTAAEWIRQRERYAQLVEAGAQADEQKAAEQMHGVCGQLLVSRLAAYEQAANGSLTETTVAWRRSANSLWLATREFIRRQENCDEAHRGRLDRSPAKLGQLTLENDLCASALLAMQQAIDNFRRVRSIAIATGRRTPRGTRLVPA